PPNGRGRIRDRPRRRRGRRLEARLLLAGRRALRGVVLPAHVRDHCGFPPLLQPPRVPPRPASAVPPRLPGPDGRPEGRALVGVESPPPPQVLGPSRGHPQPDPGRLLVEPHRLDPLPRSREDRLLSRPGPREVSGAALARPTRLRPDDRLRGRALPRL